MCPCFNGPSTASLGAPQQPNVCSSLCQACLEYRLSMNVGAMRCLTCCFLWGLPSSTFPVSQFRAGVTPVAHKSGACLTFHAFSYPHGSCGCSFCVQTVLNILSARCASLHILYQPVPALPSVWVCLCKEGGPPLASRSHLHESPAYVTGSPVFFVLLIVAHLLNSQYVLLPPAAARGFRFRTAHLLGDATVAHTGVTVHYPAIGQTTVVSDG